MVSEGMQRNIVGWLIVGLLALVAQSSNVAWALQPTTLAVTAPSVAGVTLPELDEFATTVMNDPWDMNGLDDLSFYRTDSNLTNPTFANGIFSAQMPVGDGREILRLLWYGAPNATALRAGKNGYTYPINANYYRYLSYRVYKSNSNCNNGLIEWYGDDSNPPTAQGVSNGFLVPPSPCVGLSAGWYIITVDLATIGIQLGTQNWSGTIRALAIHPFAGTGAVGATVKLDWARLTATNPTTARPYTIQWTGDGSGGAVTLYASLNDTNLDADDIVIATNQSASGGSFVFQTGVLPAGTYYIAASNSGGTAWSSGPLIINTPPKVTLTKPSMSSGQEYATTINGNAWDMSQAADIDLNPPAPARTCLSSPTFAGGLFSANIPSPLCTSDSVTSDPVLFLGGMDRYAPGTLDPTIDTSRYRYLSYHFYQAGTQNIAQGWVTRFGWWQVNVTDNGVNENPVVSRDIMINEGWNVYKIDLWASDLVDESYPGGTPNWIQSHPNRLRLDPDELTASQVPGSFQIDWLKLNAMDEVTAGSLFNIEFALNATLPVTLTFYYDTDTNSSNGRTLIGSRTVTSRNIAGVANSADVSSPSLIAAPQLTYTVFMPLIMHPLCLFTNAGVTGQAGEDVPNQCQPWNTTGVTPNTYYICIEARDPYNTTYRCSEAPMKVN